MEKKTGKFEHHGAKKTILSAKLIIIIAFACGFITACALNFALSGENSANQDIGDSLQYPYSASIDSYPGVVIYAESKNEIDEVLDALVHVHLYSDSDSYVEQTYPAEQETLAATKSTSPSSTQQVSEEKGLNKTEKAVFDLLVKAVKKFPNPSSVKVVSFYGYRESENRYYLTLTAENNFGGNLTDFYELDDDGAYGSTYSEEQLKKMGTAFSVRKPACDVAKINKALDEYYSEQGWK